MDIPAISPRVTGLTVPSTAVDALAPTASEAGAAKAPDGFGKALMDALEGLSQLQHEADDKAVQLAAGEPIDLHEVMLSRETASLHFQLALQVRNKLVEAYQDVMRMQV